MIKKTFYNLPTEKREKIIDVTKKEFLKGKKRKITINNVIESAGISRGSFYQYFDDKLDLVELVTDDMMSKMISFIQEELMLNGGDIFIVPLKIFDIATADRNNFNDIMIFDPEANQNSSLISDYMQYRYRSNNHSAKFEQYIDKSNFYSQDEEDVQCIVWLLFDLIKSSILNVAKNIRSVEDERKIMIKKINIIKNGAMARL